MSVCVSCAGSAGGGQKRVLDHLVLEFQVAVSCQVGARNPDLLEKQQVLLNAKAFN